MIAQTVPLLKLCDTASPDPLLILSESTVAQAGLTAGRETEMRPFAECLVEEHVNHREEVDPTGGSPAMPGSVGGTPDTLAEFLRNSKESIYNSDSRLKSPEN